MQAHMLTVSPASLPRKTCGLGLPCHFGFFGNDVTQDGPAIELHLTVGICGVSGGSTELQPCATISPQRRLTVVILAQEGCADQAEEAFTGAIRKQLQRATGIVPGTQLMDADNYLEAFHFKFQCQQRWDFGKDNRDVGHLLELAAFCVAVSVTEC